MRASGIVEGEVVGKGEASVSEGSELVQVHTFVLGRPPQSLSEDIVHASATAVHRDRHILLDKQVKVLRRGKVRSLV